jgi:hypothetical protein
VIRMTLAALATALLAVCRYDGAERKESHEFRSLRAALSNPLVRLRLLNAANARNFDLRFADGRTFHVIASDGGYCLRPSA